MISQSIKYLFLVAVVTGIVVAVLTHGPGTAKAVVTYHFKIVPATCAIDWDNYFDGDPDRVFQGVKGQLGINSNIEDDDDQVIAYCPIHIPDGANMNRIRIRTFESGGLPDDSQIEAQVKSRYYTNSAATHGTATLDPDESLADAAMDVDIDNELYQYYVLLKIMKSTGNTVEPEVSYISIRYTL